MDENKNLTLVIDLDTSKAEKKAKELKQEIESANINTDKNSKASSEEAESALRASKEAQRASKEAQKAIKAAQKLNSKINRNNTTKVVTKEIINSLSAVKKLNKNFSNTKSITSSIANLVKTKLIGNTDSLINRISKINDFAKKTKTNNAGFISNITNSLKSTSQIDSKNDTTIEESSIDEIAKGIAKNIEEIKNLLSNIANSKNNVDDISSNITNKIKERTLNLSKEQNAKNIDGIIANTSYAEAGKNMNVVADATNKAADGMRELNISTTQNAKNMSALAVGATGAAVASEQASAAAAGAEAAIGAAAPVVTAAISILALCIGSLIAKIVSLVVRTKIAIKTVKLLGNAFKGVVEFAKKAVETVQAGIKKIGQFISDLKSKIISLRSYISKMIEVSLSGGNYVENVNLIENVFGEASDKIVGSLEEIRKEFGVDTVSASKYLGRFGLIMREMTDDEDELADKSIELVKRIADVASQANYSFTDVADDFSSGIVGMARPLDKYGINVRAAAINQEELAEELGKTYSKMSQAEKMQARYNKILKDSAVAAGDFARTSDSWNNVLKTIQNQFKELMILIGNGMIVVFSKVATTVRDILGKLISKVKIVVIALAEVFNFDLSSIKGNVKDSTEGVNDLTDGVEDLTKKVNDKKLVAGFDNLYSLTREASDSMSDLSSASNLNFGPLLGEDKKLGTSLFELSPEEEQQLDKVKSKIHDIKVILDHIKQQIIEPMFKLIQDFFDNHITPNLQKIQEDITPELEEQIGHILSIFESILGILGNILDIGADLFVGLKIPERVTDALDWIDSILKDIDDFINDIIDDWDEEERERELENLNTILDTGIGLIKDFFTGVWGFLKPVIKGASDLLQKLSTDDNFKDSLDKLKESAENLGDKWIELCETAGKYIGAWLSSDDAVATLTTAVELMEKALNNLSIVLEKVIEWIPKIVEAYNKLPEGLKNLIWDALAFVLANKASGGGIVGIGAGVTAAVTMHKSRKELRKEKKERVNSANGLIGTRDAANAPVAGQSMLTSYITQNTNIYNPAVVNSGGRGIPNASASSSRAAKTSAIGARVGQ